MYPYWFFWLVRFCISEVCGRPCSSKGLWGGNGFSAPGLDAVEGSGGLGCCVYEAPPDPVANLQPKDAKDTPLLNYMKTRLGWFHVEMVMDSTRNVARYCIHLSWREIYFVIVNKVTTCIRPFKHRFLFGFEQWKQNIQGSWKKSSPRKAKLDSKKL